MKLNYPRFILVLFVFLALSQRGIAQEPMPEEGKGTGVDFQADLAYFKTNDLNMNRLEIYYKIYSRDLQFIKAGDEYRADYEISVAAYDNRGKQVDSRSREKTITVSSYDKTHAERDYRISQMGLLLPPGKYKIECTLNDKNSNGKAKKLLKVELPKFDNDNPQLSGIEFVQAADTAVLDSLFLKGDKTIIPSVSRVYGGDSTSVLLYYQEIYEGKDKKEGVKIETQILNSKFDAVYRDTMTAAFKEDVVRQLRQASLSGMKAGAYTLEVILKGRREKPVEDMKEAFWISWSPEALVKNDFDAAVEQLKYIAGHSDMEKMRKAPTPEEKLKLWNEFWQAHDPTPGTGENELKEDYYRRIDIANQRYSVLKREGWLTDRGMILITYGEPDQMEDFPFEPDSKAYQIWYYYDASNARRFVFVDEWGDGDYRLQYPYDGLPR